MYLCDRLIVFTPPPPQPRLAVLSVQSPFKHHSCKHRIFDNILQRHIEQLSVVYEEHAHPYMYTYYMYVHIHTCVHTMCTSIHVYIHTSIVTNQNRLSPYLGFLSYFHKSQSYTLCNCT